MMAASAERSTHGRSRPLTLQIFFWTVSLSCILVLCLGTAHQAKQLLSDLPLLPPWILILGILNLFPIEGWQSAQFTADQPVRAAAALVLSPVEAGLVGLLGSLDRKELRGQITVSKTLFNRTMEALIMYLQSLVAHHLMRSPSSSMYILPVAILIVSLAMSLNYLLVAIGISLERGYSVPHVIQRLRLGTSTDFLLILVAGAVLGAMLASLYDQIHPFALLAFMAPILLGRQVLIRSQMLLEARHAFNSREQAMTQLTKRISDERRDERRLIAADLHDEVLQPLFKVTLMAQVLKVDLATGRLLDMDEDLPELLSAAELASATLRDLIGDLRRSPLGTGGLASAIGHLASGVTERNNLVVDVQSVPVTIDPASELAIYQIAKEAIGNAVQHSQATNMFLELSQDETGLRLTVRDDGVGFDPDLEREGHYGIKIMRERAAAVGAEFRIESRPGSGCTITLDLPHLRDSSGPSQD